MADARRQLDESTARLQAETLREAARGSISREEAAAVMDDAAAMRASFAVPAPSYEPVAYVAQPAAAFHSGGGYEATQPYVAPAVTFEPNYVSSPSRPGPQFIPYSAVAPLMPGISPSGTAR
jgi:hypothetical protein